MNVLIFVMSLLMMLALLTYGRLDMYRNFVVTQAKFERYMTRNEREAFNSGAQQWYDSTSLTEKKQGGSKNQAPRDASPKFGIQWLINPEARQKNPELEPAHRELFKNLLYKVFGSQTEFQKAIDKNPNIINDLISAMEAAGNRLILEKKPLKTTDGLENLDLENQALQDLYYWMVKGYQLTKSPRGKNNSSKTMLGRIEESGDREDANDSQAEEHIHQEGTISLLDFVTINPQKTKVRVFLAPRALLLAIFGDPNTVDEVMQTRVEFYHQVKNEQDNKTLSEQFKAQFAPRAPSIPETLLNFTVTGSDPRLYEVQ
jgi:hypothetical protein